MNKVAVYGIGKFGELFFKALDEKIDFFIDDFSKKDNYLDKEIKKIKNIEKDTKIYISPLQYSHSIEKKLRIMGFSNIVNFTESIKSIPNILEYVAKDNYLWLVEDSSRMLDKDKLAQFNSLLIDKKSQENLSMIINLRETLDPKYYIEPSDTEYFPTDVPILKNLNEINFLDCGAYIGDTINELMKQGLTVKSTISFEPDVKNQVKLNIELETQKNSYPKTDFLIYPMGVYSHNTILQFSNNGVDSSASFDNSSDIFVPVVSIDDTLLNKDINFIKMDIEGAEKEALLGATKTIKKYKPNLAICLYHKPEDLWELPLLINDIEPSYEMYLRVHEDMCLSTVLYCISKERDV